MSDIKIWTVVEISRPWGRVTLSFKQVHPIVDDGPLKDKVDEALDKCVKQVRDMYRTSCKAVARG